MRTKVVCLVPEPERSVPGYATQLRRLGIDVVLLPLGTPVGSIALQDGGAVVVDASAHLTRGLGVSREVAQLLGLPVVMIVAAPTASVEMMCLSAGARQVAWVGAAEQLIAARIRATAEVPVAERTITVGPLTLLTDARHLLCNGRGLTLSRPQFALLEALMERPRIVVPRATLIRRVWESPCSEHALESTVHRLRSRVLDAAGPRVAEPVRGVGYRLGIEAPTRR